MSESIIIAVKLLGVCDDIQPEPFYINPGISWRDLRAMLIAFFEHEPEDLDVRYLDEDDDLCILSSDEELQEAFRYCAHTANVLQLNVRVMDPEPDIFQAATDVIHVNPDSLFTDGDQPDDVKDSCSQANKVPFPLSSDSQSGGSSELAETGEVAPNHVFDEETGLIHRSEQHSALLEPICEESSPKEIPSDPMPLADLPASEKCAAHERVTRKKACYYEIQGDAPQEEDVEALVLKVRENLRARHDVDSGEVSSTKSEDTESMPYQAFVHFMEKLKLELRNEIVHDVTKKTVKHILKGLDAGRTFPGRERSSRAHPLYLHEKIVCDKCQKTIIGPRYKCGNCPDYDLCEDCEGRVDAHNPDHVFIKLRRPCLEAGIRDGKKVSLLKHIIYADSNERRADEYQKLKAKQSEKMNRKQEKLKRREEKVQEKQKRKEDKLKRKLEKLDTNSSKDHPQKREKVECSGLMLPQFKYPYQVLGAEFVGDITIPDNTHVQPGTRMLKTWRMKNTGSHRWSTSTQLRLMWGTIPAPKTEVNVPALGPYGEGDISVELIAPEEPGKYQSHWKLFDHGVNFGHRVWCCIVVEQKELLEPKCENQLKLLQPETQDEPTQSAAKDEKDIQEDKVDASREDVFVEALEEKSEPEVIMATKLVPATLIQSEPEKCSDQPDAQEYVNKPTDSVATQVESEVLEAVHKMGRVQISEVKAVEGVADLLSFEFLDLADRQSKASQTATPNNTPLDVSPPKSPAPERVIPENVSNSSSVELVGNEGENDLPHLTEYVQQRMASLELKPDTLHDADIESLSSLSLSDDDSDDYCIVPLPECFNTEVPLTRSYLLDDNQNEIDATDENISEECSTTPQPSLDEILTTSGVVTVPALAPERAAVVEPSPQPEQQAKANTCLEQPKVKEETEAKEAEQQEEVEQQEGAPPAQDSSNDMKEDVPRSDGVPIQSTPSEFVNQLFHTAILAATKAGAKAYTTTKDVFNSMQAKQWKPNESTWNPPKDTWKPAEDNYSPPENDWTPRKSTWTPPEDNYVPPQSKWTGPKVQEPKPVPTDPMVRLTEMGFCNRPLNQQLLERFNNDLEPVIQELLRNSDNDWFASRHGPSAQ